jgi:hypothetical protein
MTTENALRIVSNWPLASADEHRVAAVQLALEVEVYHQRYGPGLPEEHARGEVHRLNPVGQIARAAVSPICPACGEMVPLMSPFSELGWAQVRCRCGWAGVTRRSVRVPEVEGERG